jgi:hypothetical protein
MTRLLKRGGEAKVGVNYLPYTPSARVFQTGAGQVIPTGVPTAVTFDSERWDNDNLHDLAANTSRLTCQTPGLYRITGLVEFVSLGAAGTYQLFLRVNGSTIIAHLEVPPVNADPTGIPISVEYVLAKGDYVEVLARQSTGGNQSLLVAGNYTPEFSMSMIGPPVMNAVREKPIVSYVTPVQFAALTPQDGDECYLIADAANGVVWHMRYNAGSGSAYKWEFLGGSDMVSTSGAITLATSSWSDIGPALVIPRSGIYRVEFTTTENNAGGVDVDVAPVGSEVFAGIAVWSPLGSAAYRMTATGVVEKTASAGVTYKARCSCSASASATFNANHLAIRPIRIS